MHHVVDVESGAVRASHADHEDAHAAKRWWEQSFPDKLFKIVTDAVEREVEHAVAAAADAVTGAARKLARKVRAARQ